MKAARRTRYRGRIVTAGFGVLGLLVTVGIILLLYVYPIDKIGEQRGRDLKGRQDELRESLGIDDESAEAQGDEEEDANDEEAAE